MNSRRKSIENARFQLPKDPRTPRPAEANAPTEDLYRLELADPVSPIIPVNFEAKRSNPVSPNLSSIATNLPGRSKTPGPNKPASLVHFPARSKTPGPNQSAPLMSFSNESTPELGIGGSSSITRKLSQTFRRRRTPTPPPPYTEECQQPLLASTVQSSSSIEGKTPTASRQRTLSASSWMKNVISRQSSRASLRQQYVEIPLSPEEIEEADRIKAEKARIAIAEWNRINEEIKAAGF